MAGIALIIGAAIAGIIMAGAAMAIEEVGMNIFALGNIYQRYQPLIAATKAAYDADPKVQTAIRKAVENLKNDPAIQANSEVQTFIATLPMIMTELRPAMGTKLEHNDEESST
jgi:hypothetical protein